MEVRGYQRPYGVSDVIGRHLEKAGRGRIRGCAGWEVMAQQGDPGDVAVTVIDSQDAAVAIGILGERPRDPARKIDVLHAERVAIGAVGL